MDEDAAITNLLLACVGPVHTTQRARVHAATSNITHWDHVLAVAANHRMAPLLAHRLRSHDLLSAVPEPTRQNLQQLYLAAAARHERLNAALGDLLALFEKNGIAALPMRGPRLATQLEIDPPTRPSDDLDLLLHRRDLARARALLLATDFTDLQTPPSPTAVATLRRADSESSTARGACRPPPVPLSHGPHGCAKVVGNCREWSLSVL
ncbi:MAG: nucleotidyltransferase family protein, partial [Verrucomicrobia bacterium]|nr:nucleotidyltransferase family protein [Verrucomicrobiota bacterium]